MYEKVKNDSNLKQDIKIVIEEINLSVYVNKLE